MPLVSETLLYVGIEGMDGMGWSSEVIGIPRAPSVLIKAIISSNNSATKKGIFGLNPASGVVETVQLTLGPYCIITHQLVVHSKTYDLGARALCIVIKHKFDNR